MQNAIFSENLSEQSVCISSSVHNATWTTIYDKSFSNLTRTLNTICEFIIKTRWVNIWHFIFIKIWHRTWNIVELGCKARRMTYGLINEWWSPYPPSINQSQPLISFTADVSRTSCRTISDMFLCLILSGLLRSANHMAIHIFFKMKWMLKMASCCSSHIQKWNDRNGRQNLNTLFLTLASIQKQPSSHRFWTHRKWKVSFRYPSHISCHAFIYFSNT